LTILIFILLLLVSYLIGAIPTAYLVVKWRYKKDIRKYGSGSVGASNVYRNFSKKLGLLVFAWDIAKGVLVVWISQKLQMPPLYQSAVALMVVIGHNWPVFLNFNAGRGVATTLGAAGMLMPWVVILFVFLEIISIIVRNSPTFVLVGFALMPVAGLVLNQPEGIILGLLGLFLILVIRRLTAPRTERSKSVKTGELLLNRLLFDRDIRDGKAWISAQQAETKKSSVQGENQ
jgi:acyl phosphate:glycerol-3-phosphate acyltransferase